MPGLLFNLTAFIVRVFGLLCVREWQLSWTPGSSASGN